VVDSQIQKDWIDAGAPADKCKWLREAEVDIAKINCSQQKRLGAAETSKRGKVIDTEKPDALRVAVARSLCNYTVEQLLLLLDERDPIIRTAAARELHIRGGEDVFERARILADHVRFDSREIAAFLLGQLGTPACPFAEKSKGILDKLLDDEYFETRAAAVAAIGSLSSLGYQPDETCRRSVVWLASDPHPDVRAAAAYALSVTHHSEAREALLALLEDEEAAVRDAAEFGVAMHDDRNADN
jgi:HEAT repeat protein